MCSPACQALHADLQLRRDEGHISILDSACLSEMTATSSHSIGVSKRDQADPSLCWAKYLLLVAVISGHQVSFLHLPVERCILTCLPAPAATSRRGVASTSMTVQVLATWFVGLVCHSQAWVGWKFSFLRLSHLAIKSASCACLWSVAYPPPATAATAGHFFGFASMTVQISSHAAHWLGISLSGL